MVVQKKDNKIKNYIERKKLIKKADKIQKQMKSQKSIINNMLDKLDEMDTPKGKEVIIKKNLYQNDKGFFHINKGTMLEITINSIG